MIKRKHSILKNNLNVINNDERPKYESILNKWYDGNFESAVEDFRKFIIYVLEQSKVWKDLN